MLSYLRNIIILLVLIISKNSAISQIVSTKLSCQISLTGAYISGRIVDTQVSEIFEITQADKNLWIVPASKSFTSVTSRVIVDRIAEIRNGSDENKWELNNKTTSIEGTLDVTYVIDRNTGQIYYSQNFTVPTGDRLRTEGRGNCKKIDINKKLF